MRLPIASLRHHSTPILLQHNTALIDVAPDPYQANVQVHGPMPPGPPSVAPHFEHIQACPVPCQSPPPRDTALEDTEYGQVPTVGVLDTSYSSILSRWEPPVDPTTTHDIGARSVGSYLSIAPPPHTRPLYSHIPLPEEVVILHDELSYTPSSGQDTYLTSPLDPRDSWFEPATNPALPVMTITLSPDMEGIAVYPHSQTTNPGSDVVTVGDVQLAIEGVMLCFNSNDHVCLSGSNSELERRTSDRMCNCKDMSAFEYLRQRYGSAGLIKATDYASDWLLQLG